MTQRPPSDEDLDALLRALPATGDEEAEADDLDDGALIAHLQGRLGPAETERLEAGLARSAEARLRLRSLARALQADRATQRRLIEAGLPQSAPSRGRRGLAVTMAVAAAALVAVFVWGTRAPESPDTPAYRLLAPRGAVQALRHVGPTEGDLVYVPEGRVRIDLVPQGSAPTPAPTLAVYVERPDAPLRAAPGDAVRLGEGGALRLDAGAEALLGPGEGPRTLHLLVGHALPALEGRMPGEARRETAGAQWFEVHVYYRRADKEP